MHALHCRPTLFASAMLVVLSSNGLGSGPPVDLDQRRSLEHAPWQSSRSAVLDGRDLIWIGPCPGGPEFYMPPDSGPDYSSWPYRGGAWGRGSFSFPSMFERGYLISFEDFDDLNAPREPAFARFLQVHGQFALPIPKLDGGARTGPLEAREFDQIDPPTPESRTTFDARDLIVNEPPEPTLQAAIDRINELIEWNAQLQATNRRLNTGIRMLDRSLDPEAAMQRIEEEIADGGEARTALVASRIELADRLHYLDAIDELLLGDSRDLFNGDDLAGWTVQLGKWSPRAGTIANTGETFGVLQTEQEFTSFFLSVEWRWSDDPGNASILLRTSGEDDTVMGELEVHLGHGRAGELVVAETEDLAGGFRPERRVWRRTAAEQRVGEWNSCIIALIDDRVTVWTNGRLVNDTARIAVRPGRICLQAMGAPIEFRSIRITPLD